MTVDLGVRDAVAAIVATNGLVPIADIATLLGIGVRSLQRRFRAATGVTPKEFATLRRGRTALKRVASAVGEGAMAVTLVHRYLEEQ